MRADIRADLAGFTPELVDTLELCAAELFANAVRYTASGHGGEVWLRLSMPAPDVLRIEVADNGRTESVPHVPERHIQDWLSADGKRGLLLVQSLSLRWGFFDLYPDKPYNLGLVVWAEYPISPTCDVPRVPYELPL